MTAPTIISGVDTTALGSFVESTQTKADYSGTTFSANVVWQGGFRNEIQVRDLAPQYADEPASLGGTDIASNPVEQILGAFGACLSIGYTAGAIGRGITLHALELALTGRIDLPVFFGLKDGHAGFSDIDIVVRIDSDGSTGGDRSAPRGRPPDLARGQHPRAPRHPARSPGAGRHRRRGLIRTFALARPHPRRASPHPSSPAAMSPARIRARSASSTWSSGGRTMVLGIQPIIASASLVRAR